MPAALLRFDLGPGIGGGHMARCLALGQALEACGYRLTCAVNEAGLHLLPEPHREAAIGLAPDAAASFPARLDGQFDLAVVDHYRLGADCERALRERCGRVVAIDDLADRPHDVDVLIDTAPGQPAGRYLDRLPTGTLRLLGTDYALLRREFRDRNPHHRPQPDAAPRILVSLGSVDSKNVSARVLAALADMAQPHDVTVVLGTGAPHRADIAGRIATHPHAARLIVGATDMSGLYATHDIAIGAPATSALERACMELPQILIETADNQAMVAAGLSAAAICLGSHETLDPARLRAAVTSLAGDATTRQRLAVAGRGLVDGRGAVRVAALLTTDLRDRTGRRLGARRLRADDSDILLAWQMAPDTRRYFHDPAPPTRAGHDAFMRTRLTDATGYSEIITRDGKPVALVRADPAADPADGGYEVSIVVAPEQRGRGIGLAALAYLQALLPDAHLSATVLAANQASIAAFRRAGFGSRPARKLIVVPVAARPLAAGPPPGLPT